jgi:hypothetical protein
LSCCPRSQGKYTLPTVAAIFGDNIKNASDRMKYLLWPLGLIRISHILLSCCPRSQGKYTLATLADIFADASAVIFVSENEGQI